MRQCTSRHVLIRIQQHTHLFVVYTNSLQRRQCFTCGLYSVLLFNCCYLTTSISIRVIQCLQWSTLTSSHCVTHFASFFSHFHNDLAQSACASMTVHHEAVCASSGKSLLLQQQITLIVITLSLSCYDCAKSKGRSMKGLQFCGIFMRSRRKRSIPLERIV